MSMRIYQEWLSETRLYRDREREMGRDNAFWAILQEWERGAGVSRSSSILGQLLNMRACSLSGPKVFCPSSEQCDAMCQTEINIAWSDLRFPFGSIAVILPPSYLKPARMSTVTPEILVGMVGTQELIGDERHGVALTELCESEDRRRCYMGSFVSCHDRLGEHVEMRLQQGWKEFADRPESGGYAEAIDYSRRILRIFFNACQLLTHYGTKRIGYANPEYAAKLEEKLKKKHVPEHIRGLNRRELEMIPVLYGLDQHIRLFDEERPSVRHEDGDGLHATRPHWRRGHWRNQPHGPRNELRKMTFIRPVFVNPHLYAGDMIDTRVTMSVA